MVKMFGNTEIPQTIFWSYSPHCSYLPPYPILPYLASGHLHCCIFLYVTCSGEMGTSRSDKFLPGGGGTQVYKLYGDVPPKWVVFSQEILRHGSTFQRIDMGPFFQNVQHFGCLPSKIPKSFGCSPRNFWKRGQYSLFRQTRSHIWFYNTDRLYLIILQYYYSL